LDWAEAAGIKNYNCFFFEKGKLLGKIEGYFANEKKDILAENKGDNWMSGSWSKKLLEWI
jgi:hypothetical protein